MIAFNHTFQVQSIRFGGNKMHFCTSKFDGVNTSDCCKNGYNRTFNYLWSYRRHVLKLVKTVSSTTDQHIPSENMNTSTTLRDDSGADEETEDWDDLAEEHVTYRVACFFEKLKAQSITYSATNYMVK